MGICCFREKDDQQQPQPSLLSSPPLISKNLVLDAQNKFRTFVRENRLKDKTETETQNTNIELKQEKRKPSVSFSVNETDTFDELERNRTVMPLISEMGAQSTENPSQGEEHQDKELNTFEVFEEEEVLYQEQVTQSPLEIHLEETLRSILNDNTKSIKNTSLDDIILLNDNNNQTYYAEDYLVTDRTDICRTGKDQLEMNKHTCFRGDSDDISNQLTLRLRQQLIDNGIIPDEQIKNTNDLFGEHHLEDESLSLNESFNENVKQNAVPNINLSNKLTYEDEILQIQINPIPKKKTIVNPLNLHKLAAFKESSSFSQRVSSHRSSDSQGIIITNKQFSQRGSYQSSPMNQFSETTQHNGSQSERYRNIEDLQTGNNNQQLERSKLVKRFSSGMIGRSNSLSELLPYCSVYSPTNGSPRLSGFSQRAGSSSAQCITGLPSNKNNNAIPLSIFHNKQQAQEVQNQDKNIVNE